MESVPVWQQVVLGLGVFFIAIPLLLYAVVRVWIGALEFLEVLSTIFNELILPIFWILALVAALYAIVASSAWLAAHMTFELTSRTRLPNVLVDCIYSLSAAALATLTLLLLGYATKWFAENYEPQPTNLLRLLSSLRGNRFKRWFIAVLPILLSLLFLYQTHKEFSLW